MTSAGGRGVETDEREANVSPEIPRSHTRIPTFPHLLPPTSIASHSPLSTSIFIMNFGMLKLPPPGEGQIVLTTAKGFELCFIIFTLLHLISLYTRSKKRGLLRTDYVLHLCIAELSMYIAMFHAMLLAIMITSKFRDNVGRELGELAWLGG
jgi:hypothetical protein